jgi:hypothetical protein
LSRENRPATPMPKHRRRCGQSNHDQELTRSRGSQRRLTSEPPEGGTGVGPWPKPRTLRARCRSPPKRGGTGFVGISRSSRLQGFAPLTSPLRHVAVASDVALVSSMGFVFPSKVPCASHHPGDASTGESFAVEPELGFGGPLPETPRQAVVSGADGIPPAVHSSSRCRSRGGETAASGGCSRGRSQV